MQELKLNSNFEEMTLTEEMNTDGGIAPLVIFLGKAVLAGGGFAAGYWLVDKIVG